MEVTRGTIRTDRSCWYVVEYVWKRGKWVAVEANMGLDLITTAQEGEQIALKRLRYQKASDLLEVWTAPNSDIIKLVR